MPGSLLGLASSARSDKSGLGRLALALARAYQASVSDWRVRGAISAERRTQLRQVACQSSLVPLEPGWAAQWSRKRSSWLESSSGVRPLSCSALRFACERSGVQPSGRRVPRLAFVVWVGASATTWEPDPQPAVVSS